MSDTAALERELTSVRTLGSIVGTMKALASVRVGQYRRTVRTLAAARRTIELGFEVLLHTQPDLVDAMQPSGRGPLGAVILGSDRGLCGGFNERIARFAQQHLAALGVEHRAPHVLVAGWRAERRMRGLGYAVEHRLPVPAGAAGIDAAVHDTLVALEAWRETRGVEEIYLFHTTPVSDATFRPRARLLLPLDPGWLAGLRDQAWPTRSIPMSYVDAQELLVMLVREHLTLELVRAFAESLAAENAARLSAMQAAERNIDTRLEGLERRWRRARQLAITEELLDIQSAFAALDAEGRSDPGPPQGEPRL